MEIVIDYMKAEIIRNPNQFKVSEEEIENLLLLYGDKFTVPDNNIEKYLNTPVEDFPVELSLSG